MKYFQIDLQKTSLTYKNKNIFHLQTDIHVLVTESLISNETIKQVSK